jgi:RHS repeat-associated protein
MERVNQRELMATITVLNSIGHVFARMASRLRFKGWQRRRRLSGGDLQQRIQGNPNARNGLRQCPHFLIALSAFVGLLATFSAGAQSSAGTVTWGAGNGYPPGPFASPELACLPLNRTDGYGNVWTGAAIDPTRWTGTPTGGYPGSLTACMETQSVVGPGQPIFGTQDSYPLVFALVPNSSATCPSASCPVSPKDVGKASNPDAVVGDPIVMSIGNKVQTDIDYQVPGANALQFMRVYNSAPIAGAAANFAVAWMHNYATSVNTISATSVAVTRPDGKVFTFNLMSGTWTPDADISDKLVQLLNGSTVIGWQYTNAANDSLEAYDAYGNLASIAYREGAAVTMTYATGSGAPTFPGQLLSVTDSFGKSLTFGYVNNILHTMTDPNGGVYTYTLGSSSALLSSVTYPDAFSDSYLYNESAYTAGASLTGALTGVIDEDNSRYTTTWYNNGAAIQTALAGGVGQYSMTNTLDGTGHIIQSVALVDPLGATRGRTFVSSIGRNRLSTVTQPAASGSPAGTKTFGYDANGNLAQVTDYNGNVQCSVYDLTRNLETGRVEGMAPGSTCPASISTYVPAAGTVERKTLTQWHSIWHLPAQRAEPLKITTWVYNGDGGVYCAPAAAKVGVNPIGVVCSRSEQATTDATGGSGFNAAPSGAPRVWAYTYNSFGQVLTIDGPRTDVSDITTYTYYSCATGAQCGQLNTVSNSLGQTTTFLTYNGNGQPLTISDANGVVTTLTYDTRLRLTSRKIGSEITSYAYYPTGLLETVTLPDSSTITYTYDAAHRLIKITDGLGNYLSYTLDAMGNRTADNAYDPAGTLHRTHTRVFNAVNELYQDINAADTASVTTTLGYDGNGNQTSIAAPLSRNTTNQYDALNRLSQITDANAGVTQLAYDGRDSLAGVIDPRTLATSYANDGFGDVTRLVSPDTGTSISTYDPGGNLKTTTDARGALATYSYDALNRVTQVAYPDQTINFTYDTGTNGVGRLTGAADANHSLSWAYDALGRVTGRGQTIGTVTRSVGYAYVNGDLTSLVTPSGQTVVYGYTNHHITSITVNGTTILSAVTYDPFGPVTGWTWGNGTSASRAFDLDGNLTQLQSGGETYSYSYDDAFRITGIANTAKSNLSWTYGYDNLDRLSSANTSALSESWAYDANGNRLAQGGTYPMALVISPTSNQVTSGSTVFGSGTGSYDASGNTTQILGNTSAYNGAGRMSSANFNGATAQFIYNALGERIYKNSSGSGVTLFMYDEGHHLIGEYGSSGNLIEETVWMDDTPVATLRPSGAGIAIYYVHTDHLNTPRKVTVPGSNALVWRTDLDPFEVFPADNVPGDGVNQNPSGLGTFIYNLGFPGQYLDQETTIGYNFHRDYAAALGRYIESDPIGLNGGSYSTYAYANGNPISNADPSGLLVRGDGWSNQQWNDIERAEAKIRKELSKSCSCHQNSSKDGCIPCDLLPSLLNALDTMIVAYAPLGGDCGWTPPSNPPHGLFLSTVPWGKVPGKTCKPGCLTSTLYHELLHTTNLIFDDSNPPAAVYEGKCIGDLCKKGSP